MLLNLPAKANGFYLSHGGGPMPLLDDPSHREMVTVLREVGATVQKPSAVIMVSAHWESDTISITSGSTPDMLFDYYGFPDATYAYQYPAPGAPKLAARIQQSLDRSCIPARLDPDRGFDHGMFVPMMLMYPNADIPCVQVSLSSTLDSSLHIKIGQALGAALDDDAMLIGSGFSFHNMRAFREPDTGESRSQNEAFEAWLLETCSNRDLSETKRAQRLEAWGDAPGARYCHPREEHLLPLHVCYGAFGRPSAHALELKIMNKKASMYLW